MTMRKTTFPSSNLAWQRWPPGELKSAFCHSEEVEYDRDLAQVHDRVRSDYAPPAVTNGCVQEVND